MRIFFLTIIFVGFTNFPFAQDVKKNDSLLKVLATAKHDTAKVRAMQDLSYNYLYSNPEKSAWYAQQALTLAKKINDESAVISCMTEIGIALSVTGSHTPSLQILLSALERSEKLKDEELISETFICLGEVYKSLGEYKKAISYGLRSLAIDVASKDTEGILLNYLNLGIYYEKSKRLDSALVYINKAYLLAQKINDSETLGDIMLSLGDIYSGLGNDEVALPYYRKAILANQFVGNFVLLGNSYYSMAKLFKRTGHPDSVSVYIKKSYETSLKVSDKSGMFDASTMLAAFYEKSNCDSSLKYLKLSMVLKDSLFDQEKVKHLQSLTINEQLRQSKIEEEKKLAAKANNRNLQMAGIGGFIPLLFGLSILFSKKRVNGKIIDTLGLLILLFFFQFISLIIDQYLDALYNQGTIIKFSLKVGVAIILIPVKKITERWVKDRFVN